MRSATIQGVPAARRRAATASRRPTIRCSLRATTACSRRTTRYHGEPLRRNGSEWLRQNDLIAYFCAEFGFHESLPIYSGGLGILAGDHCKSASDMRLPFVGVGLLYRQGYFSQTIDARRQPARLLRIPTSRTCRSRPCLRDDGSRCAGQIDFPGRRLHVKVWQVKVGHVTLYLLDTDIDEERGPGSRHHPPALRRRRTTRIEQEIVLGIGGVRALAALGLKPTVWHINEGHAAFLVLERVRDTGRPGPGFRRGAWRRSPRTPCSPRTRRCPRATIISADGHDDELSSAHCTKELGIERGALPRPRPHGRWQRRVQHDRARRSTDRASRTACRRIHGGVSAQHLRGHLAASWKPTRIRSSTSPTACTCRPSWRRNGRTSSRSSSASTGRSTSPTRASGSASTTFPTTCSGACASR